MSAVENPPVAATTKRGVRISDELWQTVTELAQRRRDTPSGVMVRALMAYAEDPDATNAALAAIQAGKK